MKVEDLSKLQIYEDGAILVRWPMGLPFATIIEGSDFDTIEDCRAAAALIRAAPTMLEALKAARAAFEAIEYGVSDVIEKIDNAIEMSENTNERL